MEGQVRKGQGIGRHQVLALGQDSRHIAMAQPTAAACACQLGLLEQGLEAYTTNTSHSAGSRQGMFLGLQIFGSLISSYNGTDPVIKVPHHLNLIPSQWPYLRLPSH